MKFKYVKASKQEIKKLVKEMTPALKRLSKK